MTPTGIGIGAGIAALLIYAIANAGETNVVYINVDGKTFRVTRLGGGRFEIATWGVSLAEIPNSEPLAKVLVAQDGLVHAVGVPNLIDLIRASMNKIPGKELFSNLNMAERCSKPGCTVELLQKQANG